MIRNILFVIEPIFTFQQRADEDLHVIRIDDGPSIGFGLPH